MQVTKTEVQSIKVLGINGRMDMQGSQIVHEEILSSISSNGKIIIDMSDCDYVASSGLRVLLIIAKQSALVGCRTVLVDIHPMVWDVIEMTGFEDVLEAYKTMEKAVSVLTEGRVNSS